MYITLGCYTTLAQRDKSIKTHPRVVEVVSMLAVVEIRYGKQRVKRDFGTQGLSEDKKCGRENANYSEPCQLKSLDVG
ncbi:unnamed protein product [Schistosoma mansoni]|uniref:Smp_205740 n=1 Tax=Schistosoma mansoni TaxID=6183 RepID=UPI00022C8612|nr:unnamed protein product [Schistosoma mansoni]|eukprot:XP_018647449.1 unnamed protein product [Schistosoma mansoni]